MFFVGVLFCLVVIFLFFGEGVGLFSKSADIFLGFFEIYFYYQMVGPLITILHECIVMLT